MDYCADTPQDLLIRPPIESYFYDSPTINFRGSDSWCQQHHDAARGTSPEPLSGGIGAPLLYDGYQVANFCGLFWETEPLDLISPTGPKCLKDEPLSSSLPAVDGSSMGTISGGQPMAELMAEPPACYSPAAFQAPIAGITVVAAAARQPRTAKQNALQSAIWRCDCEAAAAAVEAEEVASAVQQGGSQEGAAVPPVRLRLRLPQQPPPLEAAPAAAQVPDQAAAAGGTHAPRPRGSKAQPRHAIARAAAAACRKKAAAAAPQQGKAREERRPAPAAKLRTTASGAVKKVAAPAKRAAAPAKHRAGAARQAAAGPQAAAPPPAPTPAAKGIGRKKNKRVGRRPNGGMAVPPELLYAYHLDLLGPGGKGALAARFDSRTDTMCAKVQDALLRALVLPRLAQEHLHAGMLQEVGEAKSRKATLRLDRQRLLKEGVTTWAQFEEKYLAADRGLSWLGSTS